MRYELLDEFKDEEKWLKVFSTKAFICEIVAFMYSFAMFKLITALTGLTALGIANGVLVMITVYVVTSVHLPQTWILKGAGLTLDIILIRRYIRFKNRVLYIKNYDEV